MCVCVWVCACVIRVHVKGIVTAAAENVLRQRWDAIADHVHMPAWAGYVLVCVFSRACERLHLYDETVLRQNECNEYL